MVVVELRTGIMRIVALIIMCFLVAWLMAYLDHRAKFIELVVDFESLIIGMVIGAFILYALYGMLRYVFGRLE
jgi:hypothetical protein